MKPGLLIALMALMLGACRSREPSFPVEHVSLKGATVDIQGSGPVNIKGAIINLG